MGLNPAARGRGAYCSRGWPARRERPRQPRDHHRPRWGDLKNTSRGPSARLPRLQCERCSFGGWPGSGVMRDITSPQHRGHTARVYRTISAGRHSTDFPHASQRRNLSRWAGSGDGQTRLMAVRGRPEHNRGASRPREHHKVPRPSDRCKPRTPASAAAGRPPDQRVQDGVADEVAGLGPLGGEHGEALPRRPGPDEGGVGVRDDVCEVPDRTRAASEFATTCAKSRTASSMVW